MEVVRSYRAVVACKQIRHWADARPPAIYIETLRLTCRICCPGIAGHRDNTYVGLMSHLAMDRRPSGLTGFLRNLQESLHLTETLTTQNQWNTHLYISTAQIMLVACGTHTKPRTHYQNHNVRPESAFFARKIIISTN